MRKLITSSLSLLCGLAIIIMAFCINATPAVFTEISLPSLTGSNANPGTIPDNYTGDYESNKYYGGDAYSGMQQASAQAANNVLAMEETLLQTNENILAVNENLRSISSNLATANNNFVAAASIQQQNLEAASSAISAAMCQCAFFILMAMGLIVITSNLNPFLDALEVVQAEKKTAALAVAAEPADVEVQEASAGEAADTEPQKAPVEDPVAE